MPPLQRVPEGGLGRPRSVVARGTAADPGSRPEGVSARRRGLRLGRPVGPSEHRTGPTAGWTGVWGRAAQWCGARLSGPPTGRTVGGNRCSARWVAVRWPRVVPTPNLAVRPPLQATSGPTGQAWSDSDPLRLGSRGKRRRSATGVGASSTIWPHRWHSQRRAGGYASAHQSCVVN